jgi:hypothetical protein
MKRERETERGGAIRVLRQSASQKEKEKVGLKSDYKNDRISNCSFTIWAPTFLFLFHLVEML